ncbi:hypothetical protein HMPREF9374_2483 [Desmospora sp. 8437]|nr:hypothetical protein HMPREF9374_2483 [Desmospora sp. 8437]
MNHPKLIKATGFRHTLTVSSAPLRALFSYVRINPRQTGVGGPRGFLYL